jgi:MtN3 and saliva related transmembrane protein
MDLTTSLGLVAGTLTTLAYFPQVMKTWRAKSADGMSWSMLLILCLGISLWLVYGLYAQDTPVIAANLVTLVLAGAILAMKIRYEAVPKFQARNGTWVAQQRTLLENSFEQELSLPSLSNFEGFDVLERETDDEAEPSVPMM